MPWRESSMGLRSFSLHPSSQSALSPWPQAVPKTLHATQFPGLSPHNAPHPDNLPFFTCSGALSHSQISALESSGPLSQHLPHGSYSLFSHLVPGHLADLDRKCLKRIQRDKEDFKLETQTDVRTLAPQKAPANVSVCMCVHACTQIANERMRKWHH